jgi:hypothetical protein
MGRLGLRRRCGRLVDVTDVRFHELAQYNGCRHTLRLAAGVELVTEGFR